MAPFVIHSGVEVRGHGAATLCAVPELQSALLFIGPLVRLTAAYADASEWILAGPDKLFFTYRSLSKTEHSLTDFWKSSSNSMSACLANVLNRDQITPISAARGLPNDLSQGLHAMFTIDQVYRSLTFITNRVYSWLTINEADPSVNHYWDRHWVPHSASSSSALATYRVQYLEDSYRRWIKAVRRYQRTHHILDDHLRLVFWFNM